MERHYIVERSLILATAGAITALSLAAVAFAQEKQTSYLDVEAGAWYESAASDLLRSGALDSSEARLRPNALATRAEVMKMLVLVSGETQVMPSSPSFSDVPRGAWYYTYAETSAKAGWVRGDGDCYKQRWPCRARPADGVNRAEMAALLQRTFALTRTGAAPVFSDNMRQSTWYYDPIQIAADHCILQGDDATGDVRPGAFMNRAEMVVMFDRASRNEEYGVDCGVPQPRGEISSVSATTSNRVRITFSTDLDLVRADQPTRYTIERVGGGGITVVDVSRVSNKVFDLELGTSLTAGAAYRITVNDLRTSAGALFSDSATFTQQVATATISDVSVLSSTSVRVRFTVDLDSSVADDEFRYAVRNVSNNISIPVVDVIIRDMRTVDIYFGASLANQANYNLVATNLLTTAGLQFSDSKQFVMNATTPDLLSVTAMSPARVQLVFNVALDKASAEDRVHYRLTADNNDVSMNRATLVNANTVELTLDQSLQSQRLYLATVLSLRTAVGTDFSDSASFFYGSSDVNLRASLNGAQEVPVVLTVARGTGSFILMGAGLSYDVTVSTLSGSAITAAHFHRGAVGVNGPVLRTIMFSGTHAAGTWSDLSAQDRDDLLAGRIYVNVHTVAHPDGEIRGQVVVQ